MNNIRLGYACINMTLGKKGILTGRAMRAATLKEKGLAHASQLALANAKGEEEKSVQLFTCAALKPEMLVALPFISSH